MSHPEISIRSYGGCDGLTTGSSHLFLRGNEKIGIDLGMSQGRNEGVSENGKQKNLEYLSEICRGTSDFLITHAHMDHIGLLPSVFRNGFTPDVYCTEETLEFMKVMLENSVEIQENHKHQILMLYDMDDVNNLLRHVKKVEYFEEFPIGSRHSKITAIFLPNGHMNGSASIVIKDGVTKKNTLVTGDVGRPKQLLCGGYDDYSDKYPDCKIHTIMAESTNFEYEPVSFSERQNNIFNAVTKTAQRGGVSVFPIIAGRMAPTEELFHNKQEYEKQFLDFNFYDDAPLPRKILKVHLNLGPDHMSNRFGDDPDFYKTKESSMKRFDLKNLHIVESHQKSIMLAERLAYSSEKAIVFASGGMFNQGRSVNYLDSKFMQNPNNSVIFTSYQVWGTRGARMVYESKINTGERKTAEIIMAKGNSSHATGHEIIDFIKRFNLNYLENYIPIHGQKSALEAHAKGIQKEDFAEYATIFLPRIREVVYC